MSIKNKLKHFTTLPRRIVSFGVATVLAAGITFPTILSSTAAATSAQLASRSMLISSSANGSITSDIVGNAAAPGSGGNGQKTAETFTFKLVSAQNIGSILIKFCDDPIPVDGTSSDGSCNLPTGFDASHVGSIVQQAGFSASDFSLDSTTVLTGAPWGCSGSSPGRTNCIAINRTAAEAESSSASITLKFGGTATDYITNPTTDNYQFFARIQTYTDTAYTTKGDYGTAAGATAQQIDITAKVKEVLNFSVGNVSSLVAPGTVCTPLTTNATTGSLPLGDSNGVLSFNTSYDAHSYFRLSSNSNGGVMVTYSGDTLKNGTNQINPIGTTAAQSQVSTSQFGLSIDNSDTEAGNGYHFANLTAAPGPPTNYSGGAGSIVTGSGGPYATFAFDTGSVTAPVTLASSTGAVACDTGSVRYLGNISTATPAGIYTTTITYIATGTY